MWISAWHLFHTDRYKFHTDRWHWALWHRFWLITLGPLPSGVGLFHPWVISSFDHIKNVLGRCARLVPGIIEQGPTNWVFKTPYHSPELRNPKLTCELSIDSERGREHCCWSLPAFRGYRNYPWLTLACRLSHQTLAHTIMWLSLCVGTCAQIFSSFQRH